MTDKRIAIKEGVSELQAVKTAIHEIAHAKLHDVDLNAPPEQQNRVDRHTCEVEAEASLIRFASISALILPITLSAMWLVGAAARK